MEWNISETGEEEIKMGRAESGGKVTERSEGKDDELVEKNLGRVVTTPLREFYKFSYDSSESFTSFHMTTQNILYNFI